MRIGQNPAKGGLQAYQPARLGVLLVLYIPSQSGYFSDSLDIFKVQLASLHKNTSADFDLLVFDNGSCREVREALQNLQSDGLIDWLNLSCHNLGKTGAMNWGIRALPNELICYSDGDVYFRPGWFEHSLQILEAIPRCGMVTAQPCFFDSLAGKGQAQLALREIPQIELSTRLANKAATEEYVRSIGDKPELQTRYEKHLWQIVRDPIADVNAVIGASHFQFLANKSLLEKIIPLPTNYGLNREDDYHILARVDQLGYLQLSTLAPYVYHMGNRMDETSLAEMSRDGLADLLDGSVAVPAGEDRDRLSPAKKSAFWFFRQSAKVPFLKILLQRFYNLLFEYYARLK